MIVTIAGRDRHLYPREVDQMFRLRAKVFLDRLRWNVRLRNGWEIDELDDCDPLYLLALHEGDVIGCARFLPTTGPTLLNTYFKEDFEEPVEICSPRILEGTRFAVAEGAPQGLCRGAVCRTTVELLLGGAVMMARSGFSFLIGLSDKRMLRIYRRIGVSPETLCESRDGALSVGLWRIDAELIDNLCEIVDAVPPEMEPLDAAVALRRAPERRTA